MIYIIYHRGFILHIKTFKVPFKLMGPDLYWIHQTALTEKKEVELETKSLSSSYMGWLVAWTI